MANPGGRPLAAPCHKHFPVVDMHWHPADIPAHKNLGDLSARAQAAGVTVAVATGYDRASSLHTLEVASVYPNFPAAVGMHPWFIEGPPEGGWLEELAVSPLVLALGETGLDGKCDTPMPLQEAWFEYQLDMASRHSLPLAVHSRSAVEPVLHALRRHPGVTTILHSFPGNAQQAQPFLELNCFFSVSGAATRSNAKKVVSLIRGVPLSRLLVETDAPAIALEDVPREDVEPCHAKLVALAVAEIRQEPVELVAEALLRNSVAALGPRLAALLQGQGRA